MDRSDLEDQRLLGAFVAGVAIGIGTAALLTTNQRRDVAKAARHRLDRWIGSSQDQLPEGRDR